MFPSNPHLSLIVWTHPRHTLLSAFLPRKQSIAEKKAIYFGWEKGGRNKGRGGKSARINHLCWCRHPAVSVRSGIGALKWSLGCGEWLSNSSNRIENDGSYKENSGVILTGSIMYVRSHSIAYPAILWGFRLHLLTRKVLLAIARPPKQEGGCPYEGINYATDQYGSTTHKIYFCYKLEWRDDMLVK